MATTAHNTASGKGLAQPCSFTGKERDAETGFSYFGARYYDSDLSGLFLSVDPMADKYPSISPYAYCAWNPVKLVDPDGKELDDYFSRKGYYLGSDQSTTNLVRIIDESAWNELSDGNYHINHDIGSKKSTLHSESNIERTASLNIYKFYWEKVKSRVSDVEICMENRYGKTNHHKMEAYTKMKNHEIVRKIFVDIDVLKQQKYSDNYNDIVSCFEHENRHLFQHMNKHKVMPGEEEYDALRFQVNTSTFRSCSSGFQKEIRLLLNKETPNYIKRICPDLY